MSDRNASFPQEVQWNSRRDGSVHETTMRWILYHILEHEAGHYGQINLLAHQYRLLVGQG